VAAVRGEMLISGDIAVAVRDGIRAAMSDPDVWSAAVEAIQIHAKSQAGGWLFGGIKAMVSKILWVLLIGGGVYALGGWAALTALMKNKP
jgi:hypothetical protein